MGVHGTKQRVCEAVTGWEGVTSAPHRFGGVEFRMGRRELGHIHGDSLVDIPVPKMVRDQLVAAGEAEPHHIIPESGWVSVFLRDDRDVDRAIELLHRSFLLALNQRARLEPRQHG